MHYYSVLPLNGLCPKHRHLIAFVVSLDEKKYFKEVAQVKNNWVHLNKIDLETILINCAISDKIFPKLLILQLLSYGVLQGRDKIEEKEMQKILSVNIYLTLLISVVQVVDARINDH